MKTHELKIKEMYYQRIFDKEKMSEIRFNDRDYQVGDYIQFKYKWDYEDVPKEAKIISNYLFVEDLYKITHVLFFPEGLKEGYVCLSIKKKALIRL